MLGNARRHHKSDIMTVRGNKLKKPIKMIEDTVQVNESLLFTIKASIVLMRTEQSERRTRARAHAIKDCVSKLTAL